MKYLLIDTNCWIGLIHNDENGQILNQLEHWTKIGAIKLLTPQVIRDQEWPKHKDKSLENYRIAQKTTIGQMKEQLPVLNFALEDADNIIAVRVSRIENLIQTGAYYKYSRKVSADIVERERLKLAPFHNKSTSNGDALIYFSTIHDFLKRKKIFEFVFVTENYKDFSDPSNKSILHESLKIAPFKIDYYTNLNVALHQLKDSLPAKNSIKEEKDFDFAQQYKDLDLDEDLHLLDEMHQVLMRLTEKINFIPLHMLHRVYPFRVLPIKNSYTGYTVYTLTTNNKKLFDIFSAIKINSAGELSVTDKTLFKGVKSYKKKLENIIRILNYNSVYKIDYKNKDAIIIKLKTEQKCFCSRCSINGLDYISGLEKMFHKNATSTDYKINSAYSNALIGNYKKSFSLFFELFEDANKKKLHILSFICLNNLKILERYISGHFLNVEDGLSKKIAVIKNESTTITLFKNYNISRFDFDNMQLLASEKFFFNHFNVALLTLRKIKDHYYSQLRGGTSNNSNLSILICEFFQLEGYLNKNFIFYHETSMEALFEEIYEGLLMSYQFNSKQSLRLEYFNDYLLIKIVRYSNPATTIKYLNQFGIKTILYKKDNPDSSFSFLSIAIKFLNDYLDVKKTFLSELEQDGYLFKEKHDRTLFNLILLCSLIDLSSKDVNNIAVLILKILTSENKFQSTEIRYFSMFLHKKQKQINTDTIKLFLKNIFNEGILLEEEIYSALKKIIKNNFPALRISSEKQFLNFKTSFLDPFHTKNDYTIRNCIKSIYPFLSESLQSRVRIAISNSLNIEFRKNDYYHFVMYDIIDDSALLKKYFEYFEYAEARLPDAPHFFHTGEAALEDLNNLLNLCFKKDIETKGAIFDKFSGLSLYYDWLINMENFDYSKFNPLWILEYNTFFYYQKIFSSRNVQLFLKDWLKENHHPQIMKLFFEYPSNNDI